MNIMNNKNVIYYLRTFEKIVIFCTLISLVAWASSKEARANENYQYLTSRVLKWVIGEFLYFDDWDVAIDILESRRQRGIISSNEFIEKYNTIRNMEQSRIIGT